MSDYYYYKKNFFSGRILLPPPLFVKRTFCCLSFFFKKKAWEIMSHDDSCVINFEYENVEELPKETPISLIGKALNTANLDDNDGGDDNKKVELVTEVIENGVPKSIMDIIRASKIDEICIVIVCAQTASTRKEAAEALVKHNGDVVSAIIEVSDK